jgi:uncharacterized protein (TIGR04255 family)
LFKVKIINRIGLRYINQVKPTDNSKPLDWSQYINQHLIGGLSFATETDEGLARSFSQQVYRRDEYELTFSYGIWNDDFPNPIVAKRFILDFDCSSSVPREKTDITLRSEIATYNALIEKHFEASITDKLREELGVQ